MNKLPLLVTSILLAFWSTVWAQSPASVRKAVEENCSANHMQSSWIDCACLGEKAEAQHLLKPDRATFLLADDVASQCPAKKETIASYVFTACDSYYQSIRTDHEAFCHCSADKTADDFIAKPTVNLRYMENLRRVAMQSCGIADNSHRIVATPPPPTPEPVNLATASCVQWKSNEADMAWHERMAASGHVTGDVLLVNGCQSSIFVIQTVADASHITGGPLDICHAEELPPTYRKILRSQTPSTRPGLIKELPKVPAFVCAGPASAVVDISTQTRACACAPGVASVPMPAVSTLH